MTFHQTRRCGWPDHHGTRHQCREACLPGSQQRAHPGELSGRGRSWGLSIADDGVGLPAQRDEHPSGGLGTGIIEVLTRQLGGWIELTTGAQGTTVAILSARAALSETDIGPATHNNSEMSISTKKGIILRSPEDEMQDNTRGEHKDTPSDPVNKIPRECKLEALIFRRCDSAACCNGITRSVQVCRQRCAGTVEDGGYGLRNK